MYLPENERARRHIAKGYADDFRRLIAKQVHTGGRSLTTVAQLCSQFGLSQDDALYCIQHASELVITSFIVVQECPEVAPEAPIGARVVAVLDVPVLAAQA